MIVIARVKKAGKTDNMIVETSDLNVMVFYSKYHGTTDEEVKDFATKILYRLNSKIKIPNCYGGAFPYDWYPNVAEKKIQVLKRELEKRYGSEYVLDTGTIYI